MKFRQIRKDLFQIGTTKWAVHREASERWRLGVVDEEFFYPGHACLYYSRKHAGEQAIQKFSKFTQAEMNSVFFTDPALALNERFGEPRLRPAPPPSFRRLLRSL